MKKFPYTFNNHLEVPDYYRGTLLNKNRINLNLYMTTEGDINANHYCLQNNRDNLNKRDLRIIPDRHRANQVSINDWIKQLLQDMKEQDE